MALSESILRPYALLISSILLVLVTNESFWLIGTFIIVFQFIIKYNQSEPSTSRLSIQRYTERTQFVERDHVEIKVNIKNNGSSVFLGEVIDEIPDNCYVIAGSNIVLLYLQREEQIQFTYTLSFPVRGEYKIGPFYSMLHSKGGYHTEENKYDKKKNILVVPNPDKISKYQIPPKILSSIGGIFYSNLVGEGMEFAGIREYQMGDSFRRINWKQTARNRALYTNEFQIDRVSNFILVVDLTEEEKAISDDSVRAALGLASFLLSHRSKVGLILLSTYVKLIPQRSGKRHLMELTEVAARTPSVDKVKDMELFESRVKAVLSKVSGNKSTILLFSSLTSVQKLIFLSKELKKRGKITVLSPSISPLLESSNPTYLFTKKLVDLRNQVLSDYMSKQTIQIYEWIPSIPFDVSVNQWRIQR